MPETSIELYILISVLWIAIIAFKNRSVNSVILEDFNVGQSFDSNVLLVIHGKRRGVIAYLMRLLGVDMRCSLTITKSTICMDSARAAGKTHYLSPLGAISASQCGTSRPFSALALGCLFFVGAIGDLAEHHWISGALLLLGSIGLIANYILSKRFKIICHTRSGYPVGLYFPHWTTQGEALELKELYGAMDMVNEAICLAYQPRGPA